MRKEEGATVAASHLPSLSWRRLHGNLTLQESPIKYRKCPTNERNAGDFQIFQLIGSPIQMNKTHKTNKDADESEKAD